MNSCSYIRKWSGTTHCIIDNNKHIMMIQNERQLFITNREYFNQKLLHFFCILLFVTFISVNASAREHFHTCISYHIQMRITQIAMAMALWNGEEKKWQENGNHYHQQQVAAHMTTLNNNTKSKQQTD